jgi:hypothetical protein
MAENAAQQPPPELLDLTIDNITPNTIRINSQTSDARFKYLMARLVTHLHDFARETRLSTDEWMAALNFLVACGQISSDVRHVRYFSPLIFAMEFGGEEGGQRMIYELCSMIRLAAFHSAASDL